MRHAFDSGFLHMHIGEKQNKDRFYWQHLLAWVGGILCALVPFFGAWEIGSMHIPMRHGAGNFGFNLLIATGLILLGSLIGGYWWRVGKWIASGECKAFSIFPWMLFLLGAVGIFFAEQIHAYFMYLVLGVLVVALGVAMAYRKKRPLHIPDFFDIVDGLSARKPYNALFYFLLFAVLLINNLSLIWGMEASLLEKLSVFLGRAFTQGVVVGVCFLLVELAMRAAPRYLRWTPWLVVALLPLLIVLDQVLGVMWNRALIHVVNSLTSSGKLDLAVELKTSGLDVGPLGAWLIVLGIFALALLLSAILCFLSRRFKMELSLRRAMFIIFVCWLGVVAEQAIGSKWKKMESWQEEHKRFALHLGVITPPEGLGVYRVSFYDGKSEFHGVIPPLEKKPDVFIFMLESTRADAIRSDVAPFLTRFRDEESQPFKNTWSASNATHLSWFGFFHSRVPIFWRSAQESISDRESFSGAIPLQRIKQAGYQIEVRAVCDFEYKNFGFSNFGYKNNLAVVLEQANDDVPEFSKLNVGERERITFEKLRKATLARPEGGGFYYTALDSPHYNYYWHKDFKPPFMDYDKDTRFPLNPTEEDVQRIVHRYWNAVAWVDSEIKSFCDFLKEQGRYDESIIIVTGDHGEEFQEQGSWFHCSSLRPEQTRVPILIKWPLSMGRGMAQEDVSHLDVMPSLMYALGLPQAAIRGLAGRNLLTSAEPATVISSTAYVGKTGEAMVLRRAGYEAVFYWHKYWEAQVPTEVVLQSITGPDGERIKLKNPTPSAYAKELKHLFPDAFDRFLKSLEALPR